ncbi:MAG: hypothetical protein Q7R92_03520 [bacterium]|nr:hypothetical protein [bacterium]
MLYFIIFSFLLLLPLAAAKALPICVICTAAVSAGVGFSRWLGVDDTITGLWIGALAVSASLLTINWLTKKNIRFLGRQPLIFIAYYAMMIWPLFYYKIAGHPLNKLWGIDKLIIGIIIGTIGFTASVLFNEYLKKKNGGKAYFPFQKVVVPVGSLAILSLVFYLITHYK